VLVSFASEPAVPGGANEDFVAATTDGVVPLDGAGTPPGLDCGCVHGVAWFTRQLATALLSAVTLSQEVPLTGCLATAIQAVARSHRDTCDLAHPGSPAATVVVVRPAGEMLDYLVLADSALLLDLRTGEVDVITDTREAQVGQQLRQPMDELDADTPEHREAHREYVRALQAYRNREDGFWVAGAQPEATDHAISGTVPWASVRSLALLSDGASRLADRFGLMSYPDVIELLRENGPCELIARTRAAEVTDPAGRRWPRGMASDDATAACAAGPGQHSGT
jgi:hypothetical protein